MHQKRHLREVQRDPEAHTDKPQQRDFFPKINGLYIDLFRDSTDLIVQRAHQFSHPSSITGKYDMTREESVNYRVKVIERYDIAFVQFESLMKEVQHYLQRMPFNGNGKAEHSEPFYESKRVEYEKLRNKFKDLLHQENSQRDQI